MPRLKGLPKLSPNNVQLLRLTRATGSLRLAQSELRWIRNELSRDKWTQAITRRARLEPLQYILGTQAFGSLEILCEEKVLIPRWETAEWAQALADAVRAVPELSILDACTGTGCVPLLLALELPGAKVSAFDFSKFAVDLAARNMRHNNVWYDLQQRDLFTYQPDAATLVTSNPPYIPASDYDAGELDLSVRKYEPREALVGDVEFYRALVQRVVLPLKAKGLVFELGYEHQVRKTAKYLPDNWNCGSYIDGADNLRCVVAWEKGSSMYCLERLVNGEMVETGNA